MKTTVLSWSSGKDSAYALHRLRRDPTVELVGLLTTVNTTFERVAMHAVRRDLLSRQAEATGLPLVEVPIPYPCSNEDYEAAMGSALADLEGRGVTHLAFGDLFLEDIRAYRDAMLEPTALEPLYPAWCGPDRTAAVAQEMIELGMQAVLTCVDPRRLDERFAGRRFDAALLEELPEGVDPLGENGEFHTFATHGPMFSSPLSVTVGEVVRREGFVFADLLPA